MENITSYKSVLTIAGSDSGGCAGIQADIKSISACGAFAASVITATTAQNTKGVIDIHAIPIAHIAHQLDAVLSDISFGAIKIGMLHSAEVIQIVEEKLVEYNAKHIVLDPVMVATSGDALITDGAIARLKAFLPKATLITPNIPEAEILLGKKISTNTLSKAAKEIGKLYSVSVLLKGGHVSTTNNHVQDILYIVEDDTIVTIINPKIKTDHTHGTGCSLSSSIAAFLSLGESLESAVIKGCNYVNTAIFNGSNKQLGEGRGPINHFNL
ncbi:bifunctional hydroxymethylpyrimidine kinase/phosphomethylpyrimidine kinase [Croceibacter atlanticus]|jgi:hydroxymethylpyrimidine/phosphomethylpyrimidine kinase|uniref:hydroxymethylpyrimidine kinase n=1 Tax=Croceibacter atlanticus (strain ATCC BAA-628 / JCM 21780 / CIP 108009 / IAM 15332 / KCTC 12090 / HTCC2559) TaxID=216432 RepID=A3U9P2_CROAH|nr:bifunctional hydroxymethylpyrimidine kinase/phosphomethylpyrimidine kinase [Croceibacter atlanticus]EAP86528.1 probable phosphomethylpyrimidine kinase (ThiD) [Croceibacter atlanticus HTCC2559]